MFIIIFIKLDKFYKLKKIVVFKLIFIINKKIKKSF